MRIFASAAAIVIGSVAAPLSANACSLISPTSWLPGFTEEQAAERAREIWSDWDVIFPYLREKQMYEDAESIYVVRITSTAPSDAAGPLSAVEAEVQHQIKGEMLAEKLTLTTGIPNSCGESPIDGDGANAEVGDLVVVFDGLEPNERLRSEGRRTLRVTGLRYIPLMDEVHAWLQTLPDYIAYND